MLRCCGRGVLKTRVVHVNFHEQLNLQYLGEETICTQICLELSPVYRSFTLLFKKRFQDACKGVIRIMTHHGIWVVRKKNEAIRRVRDSEN